jgi:hypothetical protein
LPREVSSTALLVELAPELDHLGSSVVGDGGDVVLESAEGPIAGRATDGLHGLSIESFAQDEVVERD